MQDIITRVKERGTPPTRADVAELLAHIGKPGENRIAKVEAVKQLFEGSGHQGNNSQGWHVADALASYEAY